MKDCTKVKLDCLLRLKEVARSYAGLPMACHEIDKMPHTGIRSKPSKGISFRVQCAKQSRRKRLFWTVEWVLPESRHITNISETELIQDSYVKLSAQKSQSSRKRKAEESNHSFDTGEDQDVSAEVGNTMMGELIPEPPKATDTVSNTFFYLHQPLARSRTLALINLAPDSSLAAAVRGRVLLEFPTIYVLSYPPSDLPAGYVCHGDRITTLQDDQDIQPSVVDSGNHDSRPSMSLDPATIIETLQKDLAG